MSINALTITKTYDDNLELSEGQLDTSFASISSWASVVVARVPDKTATETISGSWTLTTPKITGAGVGIATLQYANSGTDTTITFPDPGGADSVVYSAASQTLTNKTLTNASVASPTFTGTVTMPTSDPPAAANAVTRESFIKAWASVTSGGAETASYNILSTAKDSTGVYSINFDTDFSSANYAVVAVPNSASNLVCTVSNQLAGSCKIRTFVGSSGAAADGAFLLVACGTQ